MKTSKNVSKKSTKVAAKEVGGFDRFHCRVGTESAKINSILSTKPLDRDDIMAKTKLSSVRVGNHLRALIKNNFIRKTDDGFVVRTKKSK